MHEYIYIYTNKLKCCTMSTDMPKVKMLKMLCKQMNMLHSIALGTLGTSTSVVM